MKKQRIKHRIILFTSLIRKIIDYFYPLFRKHIGLQLYRYAAIGSINLAFDWVLYFVIYNFILQHNMLDLGVVTLSSHIATLALKFPIVLLTGFLLQKYVTFSHSQLRGRVQLIRYLIVFSINLIICYLGLKLLVDYCGFYPTPSNMLVSIFTIGISYLSQQYFTFSTRKNKFDFSSQK